MSPETKGVEKILDEVGGLLAELERYQRLLTIMFTDISGSTSYFERHGDLMGMVLLQRVEGILRPEVEQHKGVVVKTIGDAIMAYFENPVDGVRCAIAMQRGIAKHNRSAEDNEPVRIRVAINLGMAILRGNDVFGDVVNVCARIEQAAKASTICVSPSVVEAVRAENDILCRMAGRVEMRGKAQKMDLYEVAWEGILTGIPVKKAELSAEQLALAVGSTDQSPQDLRTVIAQAVSGSKTRTIFSVPKEKFALGEVLPGRKPGKDHPIGESCAVMGTDGPDIVIEDSFAAPQHAAFTAIGGALYVDDVSDGRGVYIRVRKPERLEEGDRIAAGRQRFRFHLPESSGGDSRAQAELIPLKRGKEGIPLALPRGETTIGRKDCTYTFARDRYLSRIHARLLFYGTQCVLEDLNSSNGTYTAIKERQVLDEEDSVLIGEKEFRVLVRP